MKTKPARKIYFIFFIGYLSVLLVSILASAVTVGYMTQVMVDSVDKQERGRMEQCCELLDARFFELDSLINAISLNSSITSISTRKGPADDGTVTFPIYKAQSELSHYQLSDFIDDILVFYQAGGFVISPEYTWLSMRDFCREFEYMDMALADWERFVDELHLPRRFYRSAQVTRSVGGARMKGKNCVACVQTMKNAPDKNVTVVALIDEKSIISLLDSAHATHAYAAYVFDAYGNLIVTTDMDQRINAEEIEALLSEEGSTSIRLENERFFAYTAISRQNGWKYVSLVRANEVLAPAYSVIRTCVYIVVLMVLLGLAVSLILTRRTGRPISEAMHRISGSGEGDGVMDLHAFGRSVDDLVKNNSGLKRKIEKQLPLVRNSVIQSLIYGESDEETLAVAESMGRTFTGRCYAVALAHLSVSDLQGGRSEEKAAAARVMLSQALDAQTEIECVARLDADVNKQIIVFNAAAADDAAENRIRANLNAVAARLFEECELTVLFAVGNIVNTLWEIYKSYEQAREALAYRRSEAGESIVFYSEIRFHSGIYFFPGDLESKLINLLRAGDTEAVSDMLTRIKRYNFVERSLSPEMTTLLVDNLCCTLVKTMDGIALEEESRGSMLRSIRALRDCANVDVFFDSMLRVCETLSAEINDRKSSHNDQLRRRILRYMDKHYTDPSLNLAAVASEVGITDVYLSQFFKAHVGGNFSSYLEEMRINYASMLLRERELSIEEVARQSGYNSASVFRNAFKRCKGVSPSQYKNNALLNERS